MEIIEVFKYYLYKCQHYINMVKMNIWYCFAPIVPIRIYKIIHYSDRNDTQTNVTSSYHKGTLIEMEDDDWLEYRLYYFDKQYRVINSHLNICDPCMSMFKVKSIRNPITEPYIISAILEYKEHLHDVHDRVEKYVGPCKDFFKQSVKMKWMFANDDLDDDHSLHLTLSNGVTISYKQNDIIKVF
jgi:hypothetical protein